MIEGSSNLTWGLYAPVYCRSVQRADERARASARCILHNRNSRHVGTGNRSTPLAVIDWIFRVNIGPLRTRLLPQRTASRGLLPPRSARSPAATLRPRLRGAGQTPCASGVRGAARQPPLRRGASGRSAAEGWSTRPFVCEFRVRALVLWSSAMATGRSPAGGWSARPLVCDVRGRAFVF